MIGESADKLKKLNLFSSIVGHLGDGNFHEAIMYHKTDPVETAAVGDHVKGMIARALELEGTCTVSISNTVLPTCTLHRTDQQPQGEHSVGLFRKRELLQELGPDTLNVMKSIKQSLDPHWLMNPGKIFDTPEYHGRVWKWQK